MTKSITIEGFEALCLSLLDEVATTGEPVVITRAGAPVAELSPPRREAAPLAKPIPARAMPRTLYGPMAGRIRSTGDIIAPLDEEWDALN